MTTLTIELDEDLMARARVLAAARGMSVSEMVQRLLHVVAQPPPNPTELPPLTRQSRGLLPPMTDKQVHEALDEYRMHKHRS